MHLELHPKARIENHRSQIQKMEIILPIHKKMIFHEYIILTNLKTI